MILVHIAQQLHDFRIINEVMVKRTLIVNDIKIADLKVSFNHLQVLSEVLNGTPKQQVHTIVWKVNLVGRVDSKASTAVMEDLPLLVK